ncbi:hypothetical protein U1Q18_023324 [Sarracenia purpurea var. burkii]
MHFSCSKLHVASGDRYIEGRDMKKMERKKNGGGGRKVMPPSLTPLAPPGRQEREGTVEKQRDWEEEKAE